ncbi:MAG: Holliday junction resolvase RuvX [Actinomycetia bacterium]|nr:Holliday junction resolvase RuvX [Actinomycetes bacterium]
MTEVVSQTPEGAEGQGRCPYPLINGIPCRGTTPLAPCSLGRLLALDVGDRRCGVAVSDPRAAVATPLTVEDTAALLRDGSRLRTLIEDYDITGLVVGLPLTLAGEEGPQARHVRALTERLLAAAGPTATALPLSFIDERHSSARAQEAARQAGKTTRDTRGKLDALAATLILQGHLDAAL